VVAISSSAGSSHVRGMASMGRVLDLRQQHARHKGVSRAKEIK